MVQLFTATPKKSTALPTFVRFLQGLLALGIIAAIACLIGLTDFTIADLFASALAFLATGWCVLCVSNTRLFFSLFYIASTFCLVAFRCINLSLLILAGHHMEAPGEDPWALGLCP